MRYCLVYAVGQIICSSLAYFVDAELICGVLMLIIYRVMEKGQG
jgi:hypothetical protein